MLRKILLEIESKLPRSLWLPDDPNKSLWKYYKYLTCSTMVKDKKILIVVSIPLLDLSSTFEVFNVHNLPLPFMNQTKGITPSIQMTAQLEIEADSIAFVERTKYILLDKLETQHCSNPWLKFCQIQSPIYPVSLNKLCVVALFLKQDTYINHIVRLKFNSGHTSLLLNLLAMGNGLLQKTNFLNFL